LASTAGSKTAIAPITAEWGDKPSADEVAALDRFEHYVSFTVGGRRVGPVRITGPHLDDVFAEYARPRKVGALERAARVTAGAAPLDELTATAAAQKGRVSNFLAQRAPAATADVRLSQHTEGYQ
jgi:hypothetical protein